MPKVRKEKPDYDGSTPLMDPRWELFTELYTASFTTFYGHGQNCYAFAYGFHTKLDELGVQLLGASEKLGRGKKSKTISDYMDIKRKIKGIENQCRVGATTLLIRPNVLKRVRFRIDKAAEDSIIDQEAMRVVQQMHNLDAKMRAVERFDKIRGRIREKIDLKHEFEPIVGFEYVTPSKR